MSPYTPFFAEEMWEKIGGEGFVVNTYLHSLEDFLKSTSGKNYCKGGLS